MQSHLMIAVRDVRKSVSWYRQLLNCDNDHDLDEFDQLVSNGQVLLLLHRLQAEEHGLSAPVAGAVGSGCLLWIYVENLDKAYNAAQELKARIILAPHTNERAGWREFTVRDPDGYHVAIAELQ